ncbi:hypothetical protein IGS68_14625 [Skermanella sp. TT6]|uniref:Uncharacterized protein n=1 Tax=Skermanella cutis TaxID=2775420 RepID=A0ABX7AZM7_9PROT|nr:hypothetical protein [Skermanella sp. TT6]QQP87356.1 hypothetical protein IGS68_14625 [Skermanella sp. TT6]
MDDTKSTNVSPYLLRPLRKLEEVMAMRHEDQQRKNACRLPPMTRDGRYVLILGGKS